jgi:hypothetical protein
MGITSPTFGDPVAEIVREGPNSEKCNDLAKHHGLSAFIYYRQ